MRFSRDDNSLSDYKKSANEFVEERTMILRESRDFAYNSIKGKSGGIAINSFWMILLVALAICSIVLISRAPDMIHRLMYQDLGCKGELFPAALNILLKITFIVAAILMGTLTVKRYMLYNRIRDVSSLVNNIDNLLNELGSMSQGIETSDKILDGFRRKCDEFSINDSTIDKRINAVAKKAKTYGNDDYGIVSVAQKILSSLVSFLSMASLFLIVTPIAQTYIAVSDVVLFGKIDINTLAIFIGYGLGFLAIALALLFAMKNKKPWMYAVIITVILITIAMPFAINAFTNVTFSVCTTVYHKPLVLAISILIATLACALASCLSQKSMALVIVEQILCVAFFMVAITPYFLIIMSPLLNWVASLDATPLSNFCASLLGMIPGDETVILHFMTGMTTDIIGIAAYFIITFILTIILFRFMKSEGCQPGAVLGIQLLGLILAVPAMLIVYALLFAIVSYCIPIGIGLSFLVLGALVLASFVVLLGILGHGFYSCYVACCTRDKSNKD